MHLDRGLHRLVSYCCAGAWTQPFVLLDVAAWHNTYVFHAAQTFFAADWAKKTLRVFFLASRGFRAYIHACIAKKNRRLMTPIPGQVVCGRKLTRIYGNGFTPAAPTRGAVSGGPPGPLRRANTPTARVMGSTPAASSCCATRNRHRALPGNYEFLVPWYTHHLLMVPPSQTLTQFALHTHVIRLSLGKLLVNILQVVKRTNTQLIP